MAIRNGKCCCTCEELFANVAEGDRVQVRSVGNVIETGVLSAIRANTVVLDEGAANEVVICCAHIFSVRQIGGANPVN
jgi:uncharacterized membrane protein (DUF373 family)